MKKKNKESQSNQSSIEDLKRQALEHYAKISAEAHYYNSFVVKCIKEYKPQSNNDAIIAKQDELIDFISRERDMLYDISGAGRNNRNIANEGILRTQLSSLREKDEGEPELIITNKEIERRFPIDVSMIRPCNLSTRNKWIQQGIMWYQRNKGK